MTDIPDQRHPSIDQFEQFCINVINGCSQILYSGMRAFGIYPVIGMSLE
jgi:hypothetical protein